ncbi:MAG: hypothetical protein QW706_09455 [Candidatus Nezhaarchaeales archaeon]
MIRYEYKQAITQALEKVMYGITRKPSWLYIYSALSELGLRKLYDNISGFVLWLKDGQIDLYRGTASVSMRVVSEVALRLCRAAYYSGVERGVEPSLVVCDELFGDEYKRGVNEYAKILSELVRHVKAGVLKACFSDICMEQLQAELLLKTPSVAVYRSQYGTVELSGFYVKVIIPMGGKEYEYYMGYPQISRYPCFTAESSGVIPRMDKVIMEFPSRSEMKSAIPRVLELVDSLLKEAIGNLADIKCGLRNRCADILPWAVDYGYMTVDELVHDSASLVSQLAYRLFTEGELA